MSVKCDFKFSEESIDILDTFVYIDINRRLQTTLSKKSTDCHNYIHAKLAHPFLLNKSIAYSQMVLIIKCDISTFKEYRKYSKELIKRFVESGLQRIHGK